MNQYRYASDWIYRLESEIHWRFYWNQQKLMEDHIDKESKILEIGVGTKFTTNYLLSKGFRVETIDIDPDKNPDINANIVTCDDSILKYDTVLAFNILEHIPYDDMISVIEKFRRTNVKKIFIGLPMNHKIVFDSYLKLGRYVEKYFMIRIPKRRITAGYHHWELEYRQYKTKRLIQDFEEIGYDCRNHFRFKLQNYFHFELR